LTVLCILTDKQKNIITHLQKATRKEKKTAILQSTTGQKKEEHIRENTRRAVLNISENGAKESCKKVQFNNEVDMNIQEWKQAGKPFNVILHGDCMDLMAELGENEIDLAVVDPPYGIGMDGGNVGYKGFNNLEKKGWDKKPPDQSYFDELFRVSKNQIIWGGNYFGLPATRCFLIWDKGEGFENRTYAECELAWTSFNKNTRKFKRDPLAKGDYHGKIHPTQKPVALYRWLLQNYAKAGQTIIDTHSGSGSLACACHLEKFNFVAIEKDYDYWFASVKRYEELKSQGTLF
jgi:site-specific DNA-methyltransferase (adenine-specific)